MLFITILNEKDKYKNKKDDIRTIKSSDELNNEKSNNNKKKKKKKRKKNRIISENSGNS